VCLNTVGMREREFYVSYVGGGVDLVSRTCLILRFDIFGGKVKGMAQQMMEQGMCLISYFLSGLFSETARFCISRC
jgi:hypothetical protein